MDSYERGSIARCGWVYRQSSLLRRWRRCWLVLYRNGRLSVYENERSISATEMVNIPYEWSFNVQDSSSITVAPPPGMSSDCLFGYKTFEKRQYFCADDPDDKEAWLVAVKEALNIEPLRYTSHSQANTMYPGIVYPPAYLIPVSMPVAPYAPVIHHRRLMGTNLALGLLAGTTAATFLTLWPWMFWC